MALLLWCRQVSRTRIAMTRISLRRPDGATISFTEGPGILRRARDKLVRPTGALNGCTDRLSRSLMLLAFAFPQCASSSTSESAGAAGDTSVSNGQSGNAGELPPRPGDSRYVEGAGYIKGFYECCAAGEERRCCSEEQQGACFPYGGVQGRCLIADEKYEGKDTCAHCCPGLEAVHPQMESEGSCNFTDTPSIFVCVSCGDGLCVGFENPCTCPSDCT